MASIDDVVSVTITTNTRTPTQLGFGIPLFLGYATLSQDVITIENLSDLADESITSDDALYKMVQAAFSQSPRPPQVKIASLAAAHDHTQELTCATSSTEGDTYTVTVLAPDGTETVCSGSIGAAEDQDDAATDLAAAINAMTGVDAAAVGAVVTVTPTTPGDLVFVHTLSSNVSIEDTTVDSDYDDRLSALELIDDDWYYVATDINSEANVDLVAAWTETRTKRFVWQTMDSAEKGASGTLGAGLKASGYERTIGAFVHALHEYMNTAWIGKMAPTTPGIATWAFKELAGITAPSLTPTEQSNLEGDNINYLATIAGLKITFGPLNGGVNAAGNFFDLGIGTDELVARIKEAIFAKLAADSKVEYDDPEIETLKNIVDSIMRQRATQTRKFLIDSSISVTAPTAASAATADKANRILRDLRFAATYAGGIQKTILEGTLTV